MMNVSLTSFLAFSVRLAPAPIRAQSVITPDPHGILYGDDTAALGGSIWAKAHNYLSDALAVADPNIAVEEIHLSERAYPCAKRYYLSPRLRPDQTWAKDLWPFPQRRYKGYRTDKRRLPHFTASVRKDAKRKISLTKRY